MRQCRLPLFSALWLGWVDPWTPRHNLPPKSTKLVHELKGCLKILNLLLDVHTAAVYSAAHSLSRDSNVLDPAAFTPVLTFQRPCFPVV